jgi:hypothetical protein
MAYVGNDFDSIDPGEQDIFAIDFSQRLSAGETLQSGGVWTCDIIFGTDDSPGAHLIGGASLSGGVTSQMVGAMLQNCKYRLTATVTTSTGRTLQAYSHVQCLPYK